MYRRPIHVYVGPSAAGPLPESDQFEIRLHPPICDGDLTRLTEEVGTAIHVHIVDGVFGAGRAVTITEIRTAITAGCTLSGSTSMGALRAVEAAPLGMVGHGGMFREYARGHRTEDSDVALIHDEDGVALTVPLVNVQELLSRFEGTQSQKMSVLDKLRSIHYTERTIDVVIEKIGATFDSNSLHFASLFTDPCAIRSWDPKIDDFH